jgi:hypothetical protein
VPVKLCTLPYLLYLTWSRVSSVSIMPMLRVGRVRYHGSTPESGKHFVHLVFCRPSCRADFVGDLPAIKATGCEANHSPASSAEIKNKWISTSTFQYAIRYSLIRNAVFLESVGSTCALEL